MSTKLIIFNKARQAISAIMGKEPQGVPPIAVNYIDTNNEQLVIGLHRKGTASASRFEALFRRIIGNDIPLRLFSTVIESQNSTKKQACRPVWGGVRMTSLSTICLPLADKNNTSGIIISHHAVGNGTGQKVGQPDSGSIIAEVITNPIMDSNHWRGSDSAFAKKTNRRVDFTENAIWKTKDISFTVVEKVNSTNTNVGDPVIMQGAMQPDISNGNIYQKNVDISDGVVFLKNQILATYTAQSGDSGAPVFRMQDSSTTNVEILGIHAGRYEDSSQNGTFFAYYSPWEALEAELNL